MTEYVVLCPLADVGTHDVLRRRNRQTPYPTLEPNPVSVVEAKGDAVDVEVRGVRLRDEELHPLVVLVPLSEEGIHHVLQRVAGLVLAVGGLLRDSRMVPRMTRNDEIEVAVHQQEVDTACEDVHGLVCGDCGFERAVAGHSALKVEVARDEVSQKCEHHRLHGGVLRFEVPQMERHLKELLGTFPCDFERVLVEAVHLGRFDGFLDVPVACDDHTGRLSPAVADDGVDGERLGRSREREHRLVLRRQTRNLILESLVLPFGVPLGFGETTLLDVVLHLLVCGESFVALLFESEGLRVLTNSSRFDLHLLRQPHHTFVPMILGEGAVTVCALRGRRTDCLVLRVF